jgi:hypothetical protein
MKGATGHLLKTAGNAEAVQRTQTERLEDQHVERALHELGAGRG